MKLTTSKALNWVFSKKNPDLKAQSKKFKSTFRQWKVRKDELTENKKEDILNKLGYKKISIKSESKWEIK